MRSSRDGINILSNWIARLSDEYDWEVGYISMSQTDLYFVLSIEQNFNNVKLHQMLK